MKTITAASNPGMDCPMFLLSMPPNLRRNGMYSQSFRVAFFAFVTAYVLHGQALAQDPSAVVDEPQDAQPQEQPADTTPDVPAVLADGVVDQTIDSLFYRQCEGGPQNPAEADLCQQWRMAEAADNTARWAFIQLWVTGAEVAGLILVVILTGRSVAEAQRASSAAEKAIVRDRAWMAFTKIEQNVATDDSGNVRGVRIRLIWRNTGFTPALRLRSAVSFRTIEPDAAIPTFDPGWDDTKPFGVCGPSVQQNGGVELVPVPTLQSLVDGKRRFLIYSALEYYDIFTKERRVTEETSEMLLRLKKPGIIDVDSLGEAPASFRKAGPQQTAT